MWPKQSQSGPASIPHLRRQGSTVQLVVDEEPYLIIGGELHNSSSSSLEVANASFAGAVPSQLMTQLTEHQAELGAGLLQRWEANGLKAGGTWEEVFGSGVETDELFMAWHYACYVDTVAAAGKSEYPLPLFANAWLSSLGPEPGGWASGGQIPGEWPSGGPLPQTMDVWMAGAPNIDFLAPDIYQPEFEAWCQQYVRRGNPLFIPEMRGNEDGARQVFYALGEHDAMGVSPFGIDAIDPDVENPIERSYAVLRQLAPAILEHRGLGTMIGFLLSEDQPIITRELGGYELEILAGRGLWPVGQARVRTHPRHERG